MAKKEKNNEENAEIIDYANENPASGPTKKEVAATKALITKENNKLKKIFEVIDENKQELLTPLIENAAYMKAELYRLKKYNIEHGVKEYYQNGVGQYGYKESVESKSYNTILKNYLSTIKQLNEALPDSSKLNPDDDDDFDEFCNGE